MAKEILDKIKDTEKEADEIILKANENAKSILKDVDRKIKEDSEKIISEAQQEVKTMEEKTVEEINKDVEFLLNKEQEKLKDILNIDDGKMNEIVNLLAERIVK